jgi:hypothetical protein
MNSPSYLAQTRLRPLREATSKRVWLTTASSRLTVRRTGRESKATTYE